MDLKNIFIIIFLVGVFIQLCLDQILEFIDFRHRKLYGRQIPEELAGQFSDEILDKTCRYEDAKYKFWIPRTFVSTAISLVLYFCGFYSWLFELIWSWCGRTFLTLFIFIFASGIPSSIISIPFSLYNQFGIEQKFGFNTMTIKTWILDGIKNLALSILVSAPLVFVMVVLLEKFTFTWWILLGSVYFAFSLILSVIYPTFIAPLFNKFTPLEEGELKERLEKLLVAAGFKSSGLFIMDASKRSKHSNAYFTGFGKSKRVVLYDTLVEQLTPAEIESVLAHELGHYKNHHIIKKLCCLVPVIFVVLFAISCFIRNPLLYSGFGFAVESVVPQQLLGVGLFLMMIVFGSYEDLLSPVVNFFSRKDEFEADAFAKKLCGTGKNLCTALIKLNKENLSEITPPKIYSIFNYSHPPLLERIRALKD